VGVHIDERGIRITGSLNGALDDPLDLRLDGHRVWSFRPSRDGFKVGRSLLVPWPTALTELLDGRADVDLVPHNGGEPVFAGSYLFGESEEPLVLTDDLGNALSLDKVGQLQRSLEEETNLARGELIAAAHQVVLDLREHCDLDAFLCHGGLLGSARSGRLIGHDVDLAFFSGYRHPFDVIRECRSAEKAMNTRGWQVVRMSAASFKIWVPLSSGKLASIDVLAAFHVGSTFHLAGSLSGHLDRRYLLPLRQVELEGVCFPAPANTSKFLEFTYGPDWAVPDPAFLFEHPPANVRKMAQWFRGSRHRLPFWQEFYKSGAHAEVPTEPSWFAEWVDAQIEPRSRLVELGAGTGRDTIWFTQQGHPTIGSDYCGAARTAANQAARDAGVPVTFSSINPESLYSVLVNAARIAHEPAVRHIYARGLIDVLAPAGRAGLWRFCAIVGRRGGRTFLEFRASTGPAGIIAELERYGGQVVEKLERRGLAPLGKEDPVICRLVVSWEKP
jgi:hypothetical protein